MKSILAAAVSGFIFALGLGISGMMNPEKVIGFLDITGVWDPSLALVMGGAVAINLVLFPLILKRAKPVCEAKYEIPTNKTIDRKLVIGSVIFGIGWGIAGICPGPAIANLAILNLEIGLFVASMFVGMILFARFSHKLN